MTEVNTRLTGELLKHVNSYQEKTGLTKSGIVRQALYEFFKNEY